jgi:predicted SprT family Zn-dependent metalloprotease
MNKQEIINKCVSDFKKVYPEITIPPIVWNSSLRTCAGRVKSRRAQRISIRVELNPHLLTDEERLVRTLMHELAHVAEVSKFGNGGHGSTWQHCMVALGRDPIRCHSYEVEHLRKKQNRVNAKCACTTHAITRIRANRMKSGKTTYSCKMCSTRLVLC